MAAIARHGETGLHPLRAARLSRGLSQEKLADLAGVGRRTIMRIERGELPRPDTIRRLARYLKRSPADLGLLPYGRVQADPRDAQHLSAGAGDDVRRRELAGLMTVAGAGLVWPALPSVDWARLDSALAQMSAVDACALQDCAAINQNLWQAFWPALRSDVLLDPALDQLRRLQRLLPGARTADHHRRLCSLLAEASHLLGAIFLDTGHDDDAATCFTFAASAAREARDYDLWAGALVRHAFIPIFDGRPEQALPVLHTAAQLAQRGDSTLPTRYWVPAIAADAYAGVGDFAGCERALAEAEGVHDLPSHQKDIWLYFNPIQLLEERGASYVTAYRPDLAEPALSQALTYWPNPGRRRGLILADLARAALQLREVEQACAYGQELVSLTRQCSGLFIKTLRGMDAELEPVARVPAVKELQAQIRLVA